MIINILYYYDNKTSGALYKLIVGDLFCEKIQKCSVIIASLALITSLSTTAFAATISFNTVFPAWKGHANIVAGTKVSSTDQNA